MGTRLLVVIATGDREKARAGLMYARNVLRFKWLEHVKVVFFGPSEKLAAHDNEIMWYISEISKETECFACKAISDEEFVSSELEKSGITVEHVGTIISDAIKEGYQPMVW